MRTRKKRSLQLLLAVLLVLGSFWTFYDINVADANAPTFLYVKEGGSGLQNGQSWNNAFATLQAAMDAADTSSGNTYEIWMAAGTYIPTKTNSSTTPSNNRTKTFQMKNGVTILGGFPEDAVDGVGQNERDPELHQTILSGDLNGDDDPNDPSINRDDNAYHVFYHPAALSLDNSAVLDGVTITGGNASHTGTGINATGAGMFNVGSSPVLNNVVIVGNSASNLGGGICNAEGSHPYLNNVTIDGNSAGSHGGGMYNYNHSHPILENVIIVGNTAPQAGGLGSLNSSPSLNNVDIRNNTAHYGGGMENLGGTPVLINVKIQDNYAGESGGGMENYLSNPQLTNVVISGNTSGEYGGGMGNFGGTPELINVKIQDNYAGISGGGIDNYLSNPELTNVVISGNTSGEYGGGMANYESKPTLTNVAITGNTAEEYGGGMYNESNNTVVLTNVSVSGNKADTGGGIYNLDSSEVRLENSIVWGNIDSTDEENNLIGDVSSTLEIHSSLVGPPHAVAPVDIDVNGISVHTLFMAPVSAMDAPTSNGNYRLKRNSPAIDSGINSFIPHGVDLDGFSRIVNDIVDLGAYEYQGLWNWPTDSKLTVSDMTVSSLHVSWPVATGMPDFAGYNVYVNDQLIQSLTDHELTLSGLTDTTLYHLEVYPYDTNGYESEALRTDSATAVAMPTASPAGGAVQAGSLVALSAPYEAKIYYTTDQTQPTKASQMYTEPIQLTANTTINAFAEKDGFPDSDILTASYTVFPAPPLDLTGIASVRSVTLGWSAAPGSVTYAVYHYTGSSAPADLNDWVLVRSDITDTMYTVTGLSNGTAYAFAVQAINAEGASSFSNVLVAIPADKEAPYWPANSELRISEITRSSLKLTWPEALDNVAVTHYKVYVDGNEYQSVTSSVYDWTVTDLRAGTRYTFAITALDAADNESDPLQTQATTLRSNNTGGGGSSGTGGNQERDDERVKEVPDLDVDEASDDDATAQKPLPIHEQPPKPWTTLADVGSHWAASYIQDAISRSFVTGYPDGTFRPNQSITRAEFTIILARVLQLNGEGSVPVFIDQDDIGAWAKPSIALAVEAGLLSGYDDNSFRPNQPITRAELAVIIARGLGLDTSAHIVTVFTDDPEIPIWAKGAVEALRAMGLLEGRDGARFAPNDTATRAEAVVFLVRMLEIMEEKNRL